MQANSVRCTTVFEVLLVSEVCSLRWVYHDASRGKPLPTGAVAGGHLADGTPLYVAVIYATANLHVIGYYNHAIGMGTCNYQGVTNAQEMELLVAL